MTFTTPDRVAEAADGATAGSRAGIFPPEWAARLGNGVSDLARAVPTPAARGVDFSRIAAWCADIVAGDLSRIEERFAAYGAKPPHAAWNPPTERVAPGPLRFLAEHWEQASRHGSLPHVREIDPFRLRPALGHIMLLDAVDDGADFRYRLYGSKIAWISGFDMTGQLASAHPSSSYVAEFGIAAYRAVLERRLPLLTSRRPVGAARIDRWERLSLPFVDDTGRVMRIVAATAAFGRDGTILSS